MKIKSKELVGRISTECSTELYKARNELAAMKATDQRKQIKLIVKRHMEALTNQLHGVENGSSNP